MCDGVRKHSTQRAGSTECDGVRVCRCRARKGIKNGPKNWEYERFSFVVIRKAPRGPPPRDVFITPAYREYEEDVLDYIAMPPALAAAARAGAAADIDPLEVFPFFRSTAPGPETEGGDVAVEEREDAAADVAATSGGGVWGQGEDELEEDEGEAQAAEVVARAQAAVFLDEYLRAIVRDDAAPASGAIESLRLRMIDAGVLPQARGESDGEACDGLETSPARDLPGQALDDDAGDVGAHEGGWRGEGSGRVGVTVGNDSGTGGDRGSQIVAKAGSSQHGRPPPPHATLLDSREAAFAGGGHSRDTGSGNDGIPQEQPFIHLGRPEDTQLVRDRVAGAWDTAVSSSPGHPDQQARRSSEKFLCDCRSKPLPISH